MRIIPLLLLSLFCNSALATPEAEAHVLAMLNNYQSLSEYEDNGVTRTRYLNSDGSSHIDEQNFTTKYIENDSLHFQWTEKRSYEDKPGTYSVWKDKSGIFTKYPYNKNNKIYTSLAKALSSATGISSGLAWMTPRYLSPEISCKPNLGAQTSEVFKSDTNTITIKQIHGTGGVSKLYIDKKTYLLKKYEINHNLSNGTDTQQVTVFNVINAK